MVEELSSIATKVGQKARKGILRANARSCPVEACLLGGSYLPSFPSPVIREDRG